jgi:hypothetical protein
VHHGGLPIVPNDEQKVCAFHRSEKRAPPLLATGRALS